jgi:uncharacterized protein YkwD
MLCRSHGAAGLLLSLLAFSATSSPARAAGDLTAFADQVLVLVNQQRAARGLSPLTRVGALDRAAQNYAVRMATEGFFDHDAPDGSTPGDRIQATGYTARAWGENIAAGQQTADAVMVAWMNSPGHAANILNASFTHIGIGVALAGPPYGIYWVQDFGATAGSAPSAPPPHLDRATPASGAASTQVTLDGSGLGSPGGVTFGGVPAVVEQWGTSRVVVRVPAGSTVSPVVLRNAQGSSNALAFGPDSSPSPVPTPGQTSGSLRLRGVSPRWGVGGSTVRLSGVAFGSSAGSVRVQGAAATVLSWSDTLITLRIEGSTRGRHGIQVVTNAGVVSNSVDFRQTR